ncbi:MAG: adenylate kinase [Candidatus Woesearchaeota archaeon]
MRLLVLGSPGVGKGTYTQELVKLFDLQHISTGDIFRENIKNKTNLGKQVESCIAAGKLVSDDLTIALVRERLNARKDNFILDGFPRTIAQAEALDTMIKIDLVINFKAERNVIIDRLSGRRVCKSCGWIYHTKHLLPQVENKCDHCGEDLFHRPDDFPEAISKRLDTYEKETMPLIDYYTRKGVLKAVVVNEDFGSHKEMIMERITKVIKSTDFNKDNLR